MKPLTLEDLRAIAARARRIPSGDIGTFAAENQQLRKDLLRLIDEVRRLKAKKGEEAEAC